MMRTLTASLAVVLLASLGSAQQVVDQTLTNGASATVNAVVYGGNSRAASECDDFNRANSGSMGADWNEVNGDFEVASNQVHCLTSLSQMIHTSGNAPVAGSKVEFDLDGTATSLVYAAAVVGYNSGNGESVFVKIQNQSGAPGYNTYGFYHGNNGGGYPGFGGFFSFPSQVPGGHVTVSVDASGDAVTLDIDYDYNGVADFTTTKVGLVTSGLSSLLGTEYGFGGYGSEFSDNWELNDGCGGGGGLTLAVSNLVAGGVATVSVSGATPGGLFRHGYSLRGGGPTTTPWGNLLLTAPYTELPAMTADGAGNASMSASVPAGTTGVTVWQHGLDLGTLTFSNGLMTVIG
ncbi:MAG: hypothetical protein H8E31_14200 [Planctomycetes bacterium]|nr:hypothetical protein [Planctomycetota bacterium]